MTEMMNQTLVGQVDYKHYWARPATPL